MTPRILVGPHDRTGAGFVHYQEWSGSLQKLDKTDTERYLGIDEVGKFVWHSVADGGSRIGALEVEPRRFYVLSADIEAHGHIGGCPGCAALASRGKATAQHNDECREGIRTIIEREL